MAAYKYSAFDNNENAVKGIINASDIEEAKNLLLNRGLNPLEITVSKKKKSKVTISTKNLSIFTKQMSALLSAGTPIEKSLYLLSKQTNI